MSSAPPGAGATIPVGYLPHGKQHHFAFTGPTWAGWCVTPALGRQPEATALSSDGLIGEASPPALLSTGSGVAVVYASERGVEVATQSAQGVRRQLVAANTGTFAVAKGRRASRIFVVDAAGVTSHRYGPKGAVGPGERWLEHVGRRPIIAAARAGEAEIALVAWEGESAVWVLAPSEKGPPRAVPHDLRSQVAGVSAAGAGNRAGIAVGLANGDRIAVAIADTRGTLVERFDTCLEGRGAAWRSPNVVWIEDGFAVVAHDTRAQRIAVARFAGQVLADVGSTPAASAVDYREKHLVIAHAVASSRSDRVDVVGHRIGLGEGGGVLPFRVSVSPPAELARARAERRNGALLRATANLFAEEGSGYRGGTAGARSRARVEDAEPGTLEIDPLFAELGSSRLSLRLCEGHGEGLGLGHDLELIVLGRDAVSAPRPEGSLERLAAWVRERVSRRAFEAARRERAWVERMAKALHGEAFWDRDTSGLRLVVHTTELPTPEALVAWLSTVLSDVATRAWERASPTQST